MAVFCCSYDKNWVSLAFYDITKLDFGGGGGGGGKLDRCWLTCRIEDFPQPAIGNSLTHFELAYPVTKRLCWRDLTSRSQA